MRRSILAHIVIPALSAMLAASAGCARVPAWQRETLARPTMTTEDDRVAEKLDAHVHEYREGAVGGAGVGGGGCGCN